MTNTELLLNATLDELKDGFTEDSTHYTCLLCGTKAEKGVIYPGDGVYYEAKKYITIHIEKTHGSVFQYLIQLDKKLTGLSDHQNHILRLFYQCKSDADIQKELGIGSSSTIRNHRFVLREKERQAKVFLALMELLKEKDKRLPAYLPPHKTTRLQDGRFDATPEEQQKILKKYFPQGTNGPLATFHMKEKSKLVVLKEIAGRFEAKKRYTEKEVNEILKTVYDDFVTLRRYLIEYKFMERKDNGSQYWLTEEINEKAVEALDRRKELKRLYKEMKTEAGVYQIKNNINQKVFIVATPNIKTMEGRHIELSRGGHKNKQLQDEWNQFGETAFSFEVLEILEEREEGFFDQTDELKKLEKKWLQKLQPYGERGYNKEKTT